MSDEEPEELEEDPRISTLYSFALKNADDDGKYTGDASAFAALVDKLGTKDAIVHGSMMMNAPLARAYFIVAALIDADGADEPALAECVTAKRLPLKACVQSGGAEATPCLLAALESYVDHMEDAGAKKQAMEGYDATLKAMWEIVDEDALRAWVADERAGRSMNVSLPVARSLREGPGQAFLEWLEAGED